MISDSACFLGTVAGGPASELDQTDQPASLSAVRKKAGDEIAHEYMACSFSLFMRQGLDPI